jgi:nitroimidazol reductase NimA-like FMN-containing flavoprotein (pyridoxamine 5'-phosphate oxidase superfamily)
MLGELTATQIDGVLRRQVIGRIGCFAGGTLYLVPITYAYDGESIYAHSVEGLKVRLMRENPHICFEVDHVDTLANWQSVIAWGTFEELHGVEAEYAMKRLQSRLLSHALGETSGAGETETYQAKTGNLPAVVYRIRLGERTGRFEHDYGIGLDGTRWTERTWDHELSLI